MSTIEKNYPRFSIVTPSYNQGEFLEECIDSVLSQNYPSLEYIIMDGGSTDNSLEIIKKYDRYLTYWQSNPDAGQYWAINEGFKKTTGEIMSWMNSDDKYHHNAFFKVAYFFSKYKNIEWVTGRASKWDRNGDLLSIFLEYLPRYSRENYLNKYHNFQWIQQESTFWRRSLWEKAGSTMRTDLKYAGDLELWMRFFRFAQLHTVDTLLGGYREHGNQKAALFMDKYIEEAKKILDKEINIFRQSEHQSLISAPQPIILSHKEIRSYIDTIYTSHQNHAYKISDDSDTVINFLLKNVIDLHRKPASAMLIVAVYLLRKLHLYNLYLRHPKYFSLIYHTVRRILGIKEIKDS